jgi:hypothetical protein
MAYGCSNLLAHYNVHRFRFCSLRNLKQIMAPGNFVHLNVHPRDVLDGLVLHSWS